MAKRWLLIFSCGALVAAALSCGGSGDEGRRPAVLDPDRAAQETRTRLANRRPTPPPLPDDGPADGEPQEADPMEVVDLAKIDPTIRIDSRWAGSDNMLGRRAYAKNRCVLRRAAAERLARVQKRLKTQGLGLKVWEGYRPMWMQRYLWDTVGDPDLISHPSSGRRTHIRGIAVDVTLVDLQGRELAMPTGYCEFSKAEQMKHGAMKLPEEVLKNRKTLLDAMTAEGFEPYKNEWWHYNLPNWADFPLIPKDEWIGPAPGLLEK